METWLRLIWVFLLGFGCAINNYSQNAGSKGQDVDSTGSSIIAGVDYYSNTNIFGIYTSDLVQASLGQTVSYYGKSGIIFTATPLFIQNADTSLSATAREVDLEAGYQWNITSGLSLTPSYVHLFYSKNMNTLRTIYNNYFEASLNAQSNWFFGTLSSFYVMGSQNAFIVDAQSGGDIQFDHFLGRNHTLLIEPSVDLDFNNQEYYHRYAFVYFAFLEPFATNPEYTIDEFRNFLKNNPYDLTARRITRYLDKHPKIDKALNKIKSGTTLARLFNVRTKFTLSSLALTLPVNYSFQNFTVKVGLFAYKPLNQPAFMDNNWVFMFTLGADYTFNW